MTPPPPPPLTTDDGTSYTYYLQIAIIRAQLKRTKSLITRRGSGIECDSRFGGQGGTEESRVGRHSTTTLSSSLDRVASGINTVTYATKVHRRPRKTDEKPRSSPLPLRSLQPLARWGQSTDPLEPVQEREGQGVDSFYYWSRQGS